MISVKSILKDWLPPALLRGLIFLRGKSIRFEGDYKTWEEAADLCTGYDAEAIFNKVFEAAFKVKNGEAEFERDSVLFNEIQYSWPITAALMWAAARNNGDLHVLDFGGALGSSYFQNRKFLSKLQKISWTVIEQKKFVEIGNEFISDSILAFSTDIDRCFEKNKSNVVLLSSVLQYLSDPYAVLEKIANKEVNLIVVDRTPFSNDSNTKIKIQHVPVKIYSANYPCWFFSHDQFIQKMNSLNYKVVECFTALDKLSDEATWQGLIFEKVK